MLWFLVVVGDFLFFARPSTDRMDGRVLDTGASIDDVICCDVGASSLVCVFFGGGKTAGGFVVVCVPQTLGQNRIWRVV